MLFTEHTQSVNTPKKEPLTILDTSNHFLFYFLSIQQSDYLIQPPNAFHQVRVQGAAGKKTVRHTAIKYIKLNLPR